MGHPNKNILTNNWWCTTLS